MSQPTSTSATQAKKAALIERLLAQAEGTTHPEEAKTAREQAEKLMARYGVDQAMIDAAAKGQHAKVDDIVQVSIRFTSTHRLGLLMMAHNVAMAFGSLKTMRYSQRRVQGAKPFEVLYLIGHASDVQQVEKLINSLQVQAVHALAAWLRSPEGQAARAYSSASDKVVKRSFIEAFGQGAGTRIRKATEEAKQEVVGSELVLRDRGLAVQDWFDKKYGQGKARKSRGHSSAHVGRSAGYSAGQRANVGNAAVGSTARLEG